MKRLLIFLLLISYSFSSIGLTVNYFYCCGKLKTVSLKVKTTNTKNCKKRIGKKCCENKTVEIKIKADQKQNLNPDFNFAAIILEKPYFIIYSSAIIATTEKQNFSLYSNPPPQNFLSKNILYCVFRV